MQPQNEEQKLTEGQAKAIKPRFKIERLEERIAPNRPAFPGPGHGFEHGRPCRLCR